jgi:hypothetical protein
VYCKDWQNLKYEKKNVHAGDDSTLSTRIIQNKIVTNEVRDSKGVRDNELQGGQKDLKEGVSNTRIKLNSAMHKSELTNESATKYMQKIRGVKQR